MAAGRRQRDPHPDEDPGHDLAHARRQDEGVAQWPLGDQDGPGPARFGVVRLAQQTGRVVRLEQPSFHGVAG